MEIKNEFNEVWEKVENEDFLKLFNNSLIGTESNKFSIDYVAEVVKDEVGEPIPNEYQDKHWVVHLWGGKNGSGCWNEYLLDVLSIFNKLKNNFKKVYLIDWVNDYADDVFDLRIGVSGEIK